MKLATRCVGSLLAVALAGCGGEPRGGDSDLADSHDAASDARTDVVSDAAGDVPSDGVPGDAIDGADAGQPLGDGGTDASDAGDDGASTPALAGFELTASNTGLARLGLTCAGLAPYTGPSKPAAGTTITERRIEMGLDLSNGDVTIERSCIRPKAMDTGSSVITTTDFDTCNPDCAVTPSMVTLRDSEIDGSDVAAANIAYSCAFAGVGTLERNYIHDVGSGICFFNTGGQLDAVAEGNYVRGLRAFGDPASTGSHNESATIRDFDTSANPNRRMRISNNRFESKSGNDSGALFIQTYAGDIDEVLIQGNLLEGGGYQLVLEAGHGHIYGTSLSAIDNRFDGSGYGPGYVDGKGLSYGFGTFSENYLDDPNAPDHKGTPIPSL